MELNNEKEKNEIKKSEKIIDKINQNKFLDFNQQMYKFDYSINNEKKFLQDIQNEIIFLQQKFFDKKEIYNFFLNQINEFLLNLDICYKKNEQTILKCENFKSKITNLNYTSVIFDCLCLLLKMKNKSIFSDIDYIKKIIINPKSEFLSKIEKKSDNLFKDILKILADYNKEILNYEILYKNYLQNMKRTEDLFLTKQKIINFQLNIDNIEDFNKKLNKQINLGKTSESKCILDLNIIKSLYNQVYDNIISFYKTFKNIDSELSEKFHENIQKFNISGIIQGQNTLQNFENVSKNIEEKNWESLKEYSKLLNPKIPNVIEFIPYNLECMKYENNEQLLHNNNNNHNNNHNDNTNNNNKNINIYNNKTINIINEKIENKYNNLKIYDIYGIIHNMKSNFKTIAPDYDLKKAEIKVYIKTFASSLIFNSDKKFLNEKKIDEYLKDRNNRLIFLKELNEKRSNGKFELDKESFIRLGKIMVNILNKIKDYIFNLENNDNNFDIEIVRYLLIICQTYYYINKENIKFYLDNFLKDNTIMQNNEFWMIVFNDLIKTEINEINNSNLNENEKNNKIKTIAFSKILTLVHNMIQFKINKEIIEEISNELSKKYNLSDNELNTIKTTFEYKNDIPFSEDLLT